MKAEPYFSVVIPTYNRAAFILKTLDSVFKQTFTDYEVIVVDNKSTDNTLELLAPLEASGKISVIRNPVNEERSVSRNLGMDAAKGKYLTLLDSDDLMTETNLADAHEYIQQHPDAAFFHNLYYLINTAGEVIYKFRFPDNKNAVKAISNGNFLSCIGVFMAREVYSKHRFETHPTIIGSEDWEFWIRVIAHHPLGRINKVNNYIVHHGNRSVTAYSLESTITRKRFIVDRITSNPDLFSVYKSYIRNINSSSYMFAASLANSTGKYEEARKYLKTAFASHFMVIFDLKFLRILQIALFKIKHRHNI